MMNEETAKYCLRAMLCEVPCEECNIYGQCGSDHCEYDAIRFVLNELEELQRYRNNGWIPCDIKTPCFEIYECRKMWVTMRKKGHKFCFSRQLRWNGYEGRWEWDNGKNISDEYEILAWKPLDIPAPYKPKGEKEQ